MAVFYKCQVIIFIKRILKNKKMFKSENNDEAILNIKLNTAKLMELIIQKNVFHLPNYLCL